MPDPSTTSQSLQRGRPLPPRPLVVEETSSTPNPLLEAKIYCKQKRNSLVQAEPAEVHFSGFELRKKYCNTLHLINVSSEIINIHIIPTQTKHFQTTFTKKHRLIPGLAYTVKIQFHPDECRYFYDCIRVHCKGEENLLIPVHAYPFIDDLNIPRRIDLPAAPLQDSVSHVISLRCSCPIDFDFQVFVVEPSQAFSIQPLSGVIPANGQVDVVVTFTPQQYGTAQVTFKLIVSQFNTRPFLCTVTGTSDLHVAISQEEKELEHEDDTKVSAPASQAVTRSKTWKSKVPVKSKKVKETNVLKPQMDILTHGGVAKMMIRDANTFNSKASGHTEDMQSRQVKEALFLKKVNDKERKTQERCRQWHVDHLGEDVMCAETRREVLEEREEAWHQYMAKRGAIKEDKEFYFGKPILSNQRMVLDVGHTPDIIPCFQFYPSINWDFKQRCLDLFQQAAYKIVVRCRVNRKLACLRKLIKEMRQGPKTQEDPQAAQCVKISPPKVYTLSHPSFAEEDDPLTPALSPEPVFLNEMAVTTSVPFFKLKVPQHYKLMGYKPVSTWEAYTSPTNLPRQLRSVPAEKEEAKPKQISYEFIAPDFKPIPAHPLRIFNPAPGLHAHHATPKYLESDPEYYLCPLPTYHQHSSDDDSTFTQDHLNDEDIIEGLMTWNKDFGTMLTDCLHHLRTQTHTDPPGTSKYNKEILPPEVPYLKALPDELTHFKNKSTTKPTVHFSPETIKAEMAKMFKNEVPIPSSAELKKQLKKKRP